MSIDFSKVKTITIPEGSVKKITDSTGNILWEKGDPVVLYEGYYLTSHSAAKDTNYIDLGIKWNSEYKVEAYYYRPNVNSDYSRLFGTGWDTTREIQIDYPTSTGVGRLRALIGNNKDLTEYGTDTANAEYGFAVGNRGSKCEFWAYKNNNWAQVSTKTWSNNIGISEHNVRLFSATQGDRDGIAGIRFLKINGPSDLWSDEGALMLLVPAKKGTKYGMYDKNNSVFYPCITSGSGYFSITNLSGDRIA